ncbi:hypothetical protein LCGC14_3057640 [marine sediment metagenome]|uniref:Uncharacterized protein n=1 Tax=marine sediment metagenome TaxID=412755 RepID=A0A0F8YSM5_9ZZZZ
MTKHTTEKLLQAAKDMLTIDVTPLAQCFSEDYGDGWRDACEASRQSPQRNALAVAVVKAEEAS